MAFASAMVGLRDNSFVNSMTVDPDSSNGYPNNQMRPVKNGHYVRVKPTPLPDPVLVIYSPEMARELGLSDEHCKSDEFKRFFSGDVDVVPDSVAWATPYALSIYGNFQQNSQCPFRNGCGYGDGRAVSIQEVVTSTGARWELQLKGGGRTPFCRGGDGRAVLRSSIREFLVSEAMHHFGIGTTRALSLVLSSKESVQRPRPEEDSYGMQRENCAITCRVAPSFLRIGHFEVFGRRVRDPPRGLNNQKESLQSLEMLVEHALQREPAGPVPETTTERVWALLRQTSERVARMTAQWLRVGFCQGNFNSDNCLISGRTMDYGPFGFVEAFDPDFGSWVGSGKHFAFMNQPDAGLMNLRSLTEALSPLLEEDEDRVWEKVKAMYLQSSSDAQIDVWQQKLGLDSWSSEAGGLLSELLKLMERSHADWTITWRQLAAVLEVPQGGSDDCLLRPLLRAGNRIQENKSQWVTFLKRWIALIDKADGSNGRASAAKLIRSVSPKYVPREWMLKEAYTAAQTGKFPSHWQGDTGFHGALVERLFELFKHPYDEQEAYEDVYFSPKQTVSIS